MAGGGGGGGAGINASNQVNTAAGYGGGSGGKRTPRSLCNAGAAVTNTIPMLAATTGNDGPCVFGSTALLGFGGGGGAGGPTALSFATQFLGPAFGGAGGLYGGGGGGGAGYVQGVAVSNDGFPGGQGIVVIITTFN